MKYLIEILVNGERQFKKEITGLGVDEAICPNPRDHKIVEYLRKYLAGDLKLPGRPKEDKEIIKQEVKEYEKDKKTNEYVKLYNEIKNMDFITKETVAKARGGFKDRKEQMRVVTGLRELAKAGMIEFKEKVSITFGGRKRHMKQYTVVKR